MVIILFIVLKISMVKRIKNEPLSFKKIDVIDKDVYVNLLIPTLPLKIDTHTVGEVENYGFHLYGDGVEIDITDVSILNGKTIRIKTDNTLAVYDKLVLHYGSMVDQNTQLGEGNICDSDEWVSMYDYVDDSGDVSSTGNTIPNRPKNEDGTDIFGQKYPMQNWLVPFSVTLDN